MNEHCRSQKVKEKAKETNFENRPTPTALVRISAQPALIGHFVRVLVTLKDKGEKEKTSSSEISSSERRFEMNRSICHKWKAGMRRLKLIRNNSGHDHCFNCFWVIKS